MSNEDFPKKLIQQANKAQKYPIVITPKDVTHDSDDVRWLNESAEHVGYGYIPKSKGKRLSKISLIRCPACHRENYAMNVPSGFCTWCPFDANETLNNKA